jgi:hypothetical protein
MPEMSGIEATEFVRNRLPHIKQPQIIGITANAFASDKQKCIAAGMNNVLTKPINRKILLELLLELSK